MPELIAFIGGVLFGVGIILVKLAFWIGVMKRWTKG